VLAQMSGGGGSGVPPGDPGGLLTVASLLASLSGSADAASGTAGGTAGQLTGASWSSPAASAFQNMGNAYQSDVRSIGSALQEAAGAVRAYASTLEQAQAQARVALGAQADAQTTANQAQTNLAGATPPPPGAPSADVASFQANQAYAGQAIHDQLSSSLNAASAQLASAQLLAHQAVVACAGALQAAGAQMAPLAGGPNPGADIHGAGDTKGVVEAIAPWLHGAGHSLDFLGGAAVGLVKSTDRVITRAADAMIKEAGTWLGSPAAESGAEAPTQGAGSFETAKFNQAQRAFRLGNNRAVKFLNRGLIPEQDGAGLGQTALSKVPIVGAAFTVGDIFYGHFGEHKSWGASSVGPVASLGASAATAEGVGAGFAALLPEAAGASLIPGVGEVVLTGALACAAGYAADKAGTWVWDHRAAIGQYVAQTAISDYHVAKHVVHDLEPWNW